MSLTTTRLRETVRDAIFAARVEAGFSQRGLADRLSETTGRRWYQTKIARLESGAHVKIDIEELNEIAVALGVPLNALLDTPPPPGTGRQSATTERLRQRIRELIAERDALRHTLEASRAATRRAINALRGVA